MKNVNLMIILLSIIGYSSAHAADSTLDRALMIELNQAGLDAIAMELSATELTPIERMPLPDQESELEYGIKAIVEAAWFSLSFDEVRLQTSNDGLVFHAGIKNAVVHADRIIFKKKVLGGTIRSTCHDTDIYVGRNSSQSFSVNLRPRVVNGVLSVDIDDIHFSIADEDYEVRGPRRCSGEVGVGQVIRSLVRKTLEQSKSSIEKTVKDQARASVPKLTALLNDALSQTFELDLTGTPNFPAEVVQINSNPYAVSLADGKLNLFMSIVAAKPAKAQRPTPPKKPENQGIPTVIGSVGLNPGSIQEILAKVFPLGSEWIELSHSTVPGMNEILRISSAAAIWPDLLEVQSSSEFLRLFVKLNQMPEFSSGSNAEQLIMRFPSLSMAFQLNKNGRWIDYYQFNMSLRASARLEIVNDALTIGLGGRPSLELSGHWQEGYEPLAEVVELDLAEAMLRSVLDYLYYRGPVFSTQVPRLPLRTTTLGLSAPGVNGEFIEIKISRLFGGRDSP